MNKQQLENILAAYKTALDHFENNVQGVPVKISTIWHNLTSGLISNIETELKKLTIRDSEAKTEAPAPTQAATI